MNRYFNALLRGGQKRRQAESRKKRKPVGVTGASVESLESRIYLSAIVGTVFDDVNGDGAQDTGEAGIAGATVYLDENNNAIMDAGELSTLTDVDGNYSFDNLDPGAYTVRQILPAGDIQTTAGIDPGTIYGAAYIIDSGGQMNYVEIDVLTGDVNRIGGPLSARMHGMVHTNSGQVYGINGFSSGSDSLYEINPETGAASLIGETGYELTWGLAYDSQTDTIYGVGHQGADSRNYLLIIDPADASVTQIGTGYEGLTATSALAFDAVNSRVIAFDNNDDEFVAFDLDGTATQIADFSGINTWSLTDSPDGFLYGGIGTAGTPPLRETFRSIDLGTGAQATYLVLSEAAPLESADWDNDPTRYRIMVGVGETVSDINFGNLGQSLLGELHGTKFEDLDGDGVRDAGEGPLEGVTIYLDLNDNGQLDNEPTTVTDANGDYSFAGLVAGDYVIREVVPEGFQPTTPVASDGRLFANDTFAFPDLIVELDPSTGSVINQFNAPITSGFTSNGLAFDGDVLYYLNNIDDTLYELDPNDGTVLDATLLPSGGYVGVATLDGLVYAFDTFQDDVVIFDPAANSVLGELDLNGVNPGVFFNDGLGELTNTGELIAMTSTAIHLLDPLTGLINSSFFLTSGFSPRGVTSIDGEIYVSFTSNDIDVYSPDGTLLRTISNTVDAFGLGGSDSILDDAHRVTLATGEILTGLDFGNQSLFGEIRGTKFEDLDGDGVRDAGEGPLEGVTIYLDLNDNGQLDIGNTVDPDDLASGTPINDAFEGVTFTAINSFGTPIFGGQVLALASSIASTDPNVIGNVSPTWFASGRLLRMDFDQLVANVSIDYISGFGFGSIGQLQVFDADGNLLETVATDELTTGQFQTLSVLRETADIAYAIASPQTVFGQLDQLVFGTPEPSVVTDADGNYSFTGILAGDYVVREVLPEGFQQTTPLPRDGRLFANDTFASPDLIVELDPSDGSVINQFETPVPFGSIFNGLAFDGNALYFLTDSDEMLYELDPDDGTVLDSTLLPSGIYTGVATLNGLVYAFDTLQDDVLIFDPASNSVIGELDLNGVNSGVFFNDGLGELSSTGELIAMSSSAVYLIDPNTGSINSSFTLVSGFSPRGVTSVDGEIYVGFTTGTIDVYSPSGSRLRTISGTVDSFGLGGSDSVLDDAYRVTLEPSQILTGLDFGNQSLFGDIHGTKFEDLDGDGVRDAGEGPLEGVTIYLDLNDNGAADLFSGAADADGFAIGTDLESVFDGVTLSVAGSNNESNTFFRVLSGADTLSSTGTNVFSQSGNNFWSSGFRFRADFDELVADVSLDFISSSTFGQTGTLLAFDAAGNLLETYTTENLSRGNVETMTIARETSDIAYVVAYTLAGSFGRLDNLVFGNPEPFAITDADGNYSFTGILAGEYVVREIVPEGFLQTSPGIQPGRLFATDTFTSPDRIFELDPLTGAEINSFTRPDQSIFNGLAFDGSVLYQVDDTNDMLYELDPDTGAVLDSAVLPTGIYDGLATLNGLVYAMGTFANEIVVFDPVTNTVVDTLTITGVTAAFVNDGFGEITGPDALIARTIFGELVFIDPATGVGTVGFNLGSSFTVRGITSVNGEIYVGTTDGIIRVYDREGTLLRTITNTVETFALGGTDGGFDDAHRVTLGPSQVVTGLDFGNYINRPPEADPNGPYVINEGDSVTLDASGSTDPNGDPLTFTWDVNNDGVFGDAVGVTPTLTRDQLAALGIGDDGIFTVTVLASDGELTDTAESTLTVNNVDPSVLLDPVSAINENEAATLTGSFTDPGIFDSHDVVVDWDDPNYATDSTFSLPVLNTLSAGDTFNSTDGLVLTITSVNLLTGQVGFRVQHRYLDDGVAPGNSTPSDTSTIIVRVSDDDSGSGQDDTDVLVSNVDPVITGFTNSSPLSNKANEGDTVSLSADFTDAGTLDIHSVTVDWGDGTTSGGTITQGAGFGSLLAEHVYATGGIYTVTVTLFDDDAGSDSFETVVAVTGIGLTSEGVLQIVGTASADLVTVVQVDGMSFRVQADFLTDPEQYRDFYLSDVESLQIFMCEGDDQVNIGGNIELSAFVDAGAGNDNVNGGSGNDVILGGPGDDHLNGGDGRDILIGGLGSDVLVGQSDGDLLMGGRTAYDGDPTTNTLPDFGAWESLLARWSGPGDAAARAANLADDSIDGFLLTLGVTVFDDGDQDELTGGSKSDWFWALGDDLLTDAEEGDLIT